MDEQTFDESGSTENVLSEFCLPIREADFQETLEPFFLPAEDDKEDSSPLTESSDNIGKVWPVVIIEACVSDNKNWYRAEVLKEAIERFEGSPARIYRFTTNFQSRYDHVPGYVAARNSGAVVGNTVGQFKNVKLETVPSTRTPGQMVEALTADLYFIDDRTQQKFVNAAKIGSMPRDRSALFQLSIEAEGPHSLVLHESGKQVRMVESISNVREVTIVSRGAAGGVAIIPDDLYSFIPGVRESKKEPEQTFDKATPQEKNSDSGPEKSDLPKPKGSVPAEDVEKAILVGRTGNMDLCLSILEDSVFNSQKSNQNGPEVRNPLEDPRDSALAVNQDKGNENPVTPKPSKDNNSSTEPPSDPEDSEDVDEPPEEDSEEEDDGEENLKKKPKKLSKSMTKKESKIETEPKMSKENTQQTEPGAGSVRNNPAQNEFANFVASGQAQQSDERYFSESEVHQFVRQMAANDRARDERIAESENYLAGLAEALQEQQNKLEQQAYENELKECRRVLSFKLRESKLPVATQTMIAKQFDGQIFEAEDLDAAIKEHNAYIHQMAESFGFNQGRGGMQNGNGAPAGMFGPNGYNRNSGVSAGFSNVDRVQAELCRAFGYDFTADESLTEAERELYRSLPTMPSIRRPMQMWHDDQDCMLRGNVGEYAVLKEATSTDTSMQYLLQNSMTKALMQRYMSQPQIWKDFTNVVPVANFLEQQLMVMGGLGKLPQVVESSSGTTYLSLGTPSTAQVKYEIGTFGGLIKVTRQAIINDNLQGIQRFPQEAAEAAVMTLNTYVFGTLIGKYNSKQSANGTINSALSYDGYAIYHANHINKITSAMSYANLITMLNNLRNQRRFANVTTVNNSGVINIGDSTFTVSDADFASGIKAGDDLRVYGVTYEDVVVSSVSSLTITISGTFAAAHADGVRVEQLGAPIAFPDAKLLYPIEMSATAFQLLASPLIPGSTTNDANALYPAFQQKRLIPYDIHKMYLGGDTDNYYMVAGKPLITGFLGGKEDPTLQLQDNPLVGQVFTGDLISWKVFQEHGHALPEHRQVQGGIV